MKNTKEVSQILYTEIHRRYRLMFIHLKTTDCNIICQAFCTTGRLATLSYWTVTSANFYLLSII